jgi:adenosylhomocysteinase
MKSSYAPQFFSDVVNGMKFSQTEFVVVTHILPDRPCFINAINTVAPVKYIIPKPNSIHQETLDHLRQYYTILPLKREVFSDGELVLRKLKGSGKQLIILDIGGYFSPCINYLVKKLDAQIVGVVEDTENGLQKYEKLQTLPCPIFSVARSPLKDPEDFLVGQSIVFSTDAVLRTNNAILNNKNVGVIGYGKVGRSISMSLSGRNITTYVYDIDPIRRIQAISHGFSSLSKEELLKRSDILFCATGNFSLTRKDFKKIKNGCAIASVTSSDDELDMRNLSSDYEASEINSCITKYQNHNNYFYLLNKGNAINFLHDAVVGSFIFLVQAEILKAAELLMNTKYTNDIHILSSEERKKLAVKWLKYFG